ncbi:hypothetical protein [Scytonema sp. NUACC21]
MQLVVCSVMGWKALERSFGYREQARYCNLQTAWVLPSLPGSLQSSSCTPRKMKWL